jgi:hypothetical protein
MSPTVGVRIGARSPRASSRPSRIATSILLMLVVLSAGACFKRSVMHQDVNGSITLRVANNNQLDVTVYVVNQGMRVRVGTVTSTSTAHFELPLRQIGSAGEFRLLADPIGSTRTVTSEVVHVFPGQVVEWMLAPDLRQSSLSIRG